jgi:hypothetical protein
MQVKLWLDDIRDPVRFGRLGWLWVKDYDAALEALQTLEISEASLDHDLSLLQTIGQVDEEKTGYDVVLWMEEHGVFPPEGVTVHSANPAGARRMVAGLHAICRRKGLPESLVVQRTAYDVTSEFTIRDLGNPAE